MCGAFSSTVEVWDGGWRAVMVRGCLLRSLLKPILSVTAGGSGELRGDGEKINGAAGDHPLARHDTHTHTALVGFFCSVYLSLTPFFSFFHSPLTVRLSFCHPEPVSVSFSTFFFHFPPPTLLLYEQQARYAFDIRPVSDPEI